ncbi:MAG: L-histidine N(alpha)-methyltransferase, partial [Balneolaceae bacterium]
VQPDDMLTEIIRGLSRTQKKVPSKFFYDEEGSKLFEKICRLDEYYLTDAEIRIMQMNIGEIKQAFPARIDLIELGSGSSTKTRLLLNHIDGIRTYYPVDISGEYLAGVASRLRRAYPRLAVKPVIADYTRPFTIPGGPDGSAGNRRIAYYPGSTIGNFTPEAARNFLSSVADLVGEDGGLLIGVDLKKDGEILKAAYNDSEGMTSRFNKNLLVRMNREYDADFDPGRFRHRAVFNEEEGRIEMHLVSLISQRVQLAGYTFFFRRGETIHTENSYKYTVDEFSRLTAGIFEVKKVWTDNDHLFSVHYLE